MRDRKSDLLFSFRRGNSDSYSFQQSSSNTKKGRRRKKNQDEDEEDAEEEVVEVQLKRASWSSFPLLRYASISSSSSSPFSSTTALAAEDRITVRRKSQSNEDLQLQQQRRQLQERDHLQQQQQQQQKSKVKRKQQQQQKLPVVATPKIGCGFFSVLSHSSSSTSTPYTCSSSWSSSSYPTSSAFQSSDLSVKSSIPTSLEGWEEEEEEGEDESQTFARHQRPRQQSLPNNFKRPKNFISRTTIDNLSSYRCPQATYRPQRALGNEGEGGGGTGDDSMTFDHYHQQHQHNPLRSSATTFSGTKIFRTASDYLPSSRYGATIDQGLDEMGGSYSVPILPRAGAEGSATSPRIIYIHKKTPDVKRRSRKEIVRELETARKTGTLTSDVSRADDEKERKEEELQEEKRKEEEEKENHKPKPKEDKTKKNTRFMQSYNRFFGRTGKLRVTTGGREEEAEVKKEARKEGVKESREEGWREGVGEREGRSRIESSVLEKEKWEEVEEERWEGEMETKHIEREGARGGRVGEKMQLEGRWEVEEGEMEVKHLVRIHGGREVEGRREERMREGEAGKRKTERGDREKESAGKIERGEREGDRVETEVERGDREGERGGREVERNDAEAHRDVTETLLYVGAADGHCDSPPPPTPDNDNSSSSSKPSTGLYLTSIQSHHAAPQPRQQKPQQQYTSQQQQWYGKQKQQQQEQQQQQYQGFSHQHYPVHLSALSCCSGGSWQQHHSTYRQHHSSPVSQHHSASPQHQHTQQSLQHHHTSPQHQANPLQCLEDTRCLGSLTQQSQQRNSPIQLYHSSPQHRSSPTQLHHSSPQHRNSPTQFCHSSPQHRTSPATQLSQGSPQHYHNLPQHYLTQSGEHHGRHTPQHNNNNKVQQQKQQPSKPDFTLNSFLTAHLLDAAVTKHQQSSPSCSDCAVLEGRVAVNGNPALGRRGLEVSNAVNEYAVIEGESEVESTGSCVSDKGTQLAGSIASDPVYTNCAQTIPNLSSSSTATTSPHLSSTSPQISSTTQHLSPTTPHLSITTPHILSTTPHLSSTSPHFSSPTTTTNNQYVAGSTNFYFEPAGPHDAPNDIDPTTSLSTSSSSSSCSSNTFAVTYNQSFGIIGDIIEEEEEEEEEGYMSQGIIDSTFFERDMETQLEELGNKVEDEEMEEEDTEGGKHEREDVLNGGVALSHPSSLTTTTRTPKKTDLKIVLAPPPHRAIQQIQRTWVLRHISEEAETRSVGSGGDEAEAEVEVELRSTPTTPRSPAIDFEEVFKQQKEALEEATDDMSTVRELATRLRLATRRPSYLDWAAQLRERGREVGEALATHSPVVVENGQEGEVEEEQRRENLQKAVDWVKKELIEMRAQDQELAKQLIRLRVEVQRLRLLRSCSHHQQLVDHLVSEAEEAKFAPDLCDLPSDLSEPFFSPALRDIGVTKMNLTSRRFSLR